MKFINSMLLGSAALVLAGAAQAADVPSPQPRPSADANKCAAWGAGYYYLPFSNTCLKIGGVVRAEYFLRPGAPSGVANQSAYNAAGTAYSRDLDQYRGRMYLTLDDYTSTPFGDARGYFSLRETYDSLPSSPAGGGKIVALGLPAGAKENAGLFQGLPNEQTYVDAAFVQWAGITAGVAHSFFDFYTHNYEMTSSSVGVSDQPLVLLGYTAKFGSGFTASASAEDPSARRIGDSTADIGIANNDPKSATTAAYLTYGGVSVPDIVGNFRYDGGWGSAQLAGALHQVNSDPLFGCSSAVVTTGNCGNAGDKYFLPVGYTPATAWGFAVEGGAKIKLDAISPGDSTTVQVTYEEGAMDYVNSTNYYAGTPSIYSHGVSVSVPLNDAFVLPNGSIGMNKGLGAFAGYQHFWTPSLRSNVFGSYLQIENPVAAQLLGAGTDNAKIWDVGFNTFWSPIQALDIGVEVVYTNMTLTGGYPLATGTVLPNTATKGPVSATADDIRARLRVQLAF
jgi:hypothetical protein